MEESVDRQVEKVLTEFSGWGTISDLASFVEPRVVLPEDFRATAAHDRLMRVIRRKIKQRVDADGLSVFESVEKQTADGDTERVYKQLDLFTKDDYGIAITYYSDRTRYNAQKANSLTRRCNERLKTKRHLPFSQFGTFGDNQSKTA